MGNNSLPASRLQIVVNFQLFEKQFEKKTVLFKKMSFYLDEKYNSLLKPSLQLTTI